LISCIYALHGACECSCGALDVRGLKSCNSIDINSCCVSGRGKGPFLQRSCSTWLIEALALRGKTLQPQRVKAFDLWQLEKGGMNQRKGLWEEVCVSGPLLGIRIIIVCVCVCVCVLLGDEWLRGYAINSALLCILHSHIRRFSLWSYDR